MTSIDYLIYACFAALTTAALLHLWFRTSAAGEYIGLIDLFCALCAGWSSTIDRRTMWSQGIQGPVEPPAQIPTPGLKYWTWARARRSEAQARQQAHAPAAVRPAPAVTKRCRNGACRPSPETIQPDAPAPAPAAAEPTEKEKARADRIAAIRQAAAQPEEERVNTSFPLWLGMIAPRNPGAFAALVEALRAGRYTQETAVLAIEAALAFLARLATCPHCIGLWMAVIASLCFGVTSAALAVYLVGIILFLRVRA